MASRHRSREQALQMIYQWDLTRAPVERVRETYWGNLSQATPGSTPEEESFADRLLQGVAGRIAEIDALLVKHAANWRLERMSAVDRNILRLAIYELLEQSAAPAVVINEALEIGRRYSGDESVAFLNGVLDAVRQQLEDGKPSPVQG